MTGVAKLLIECGHFKATEREVHVFEMDFVYEISPKHKFGCKDRKTNNITLHIYYCL